MEARDWWFPASAYTIVQRSGANLYPPPPLADGFQHLFVGVEPISFVY